MSAPSGGGGESSPPLIRNLVVSSVIVRRGEDARSGVQLAVRQRWADRRVRARPLAVLGLNLMGDCLRDRLDPKRARKR